MQSITPSDLRFVLSRLPKDIRDLMMQEPKVWLAGGFIRARIAGEKPSDIDLFTNTKARADELMYRLQRGRHGAKITSTDNALTLTASPRMPVQFITRWLFESAPDLLESFDFTIARAVVWFNQEVNAWVGICDDGFYPDLAARRLVYCHPEREEEAGGSLMRVRKFLCRGYNIQAEALAGVISRVTNETIQRLTEGVNWEVLKRYDEKMVRRIIASILREVDPLTVVDGTEVVDEHAVMASLPISDDSEPSTVE